MVNMMQKNNDAPPQGGFIFPKNKLAGAYLFYCPYYFWSKESFGVFRRRVCGKKRMAYSLFVVPVYKKQVVIPGLTQNPESGELDPESSSG